MINKITPSVEQNYRLKSLDTTSWGLTNYNLKDTLNFV